MGSFSARLFLAACISAAPVTAWAQGGIQNHIITPDRTVTVRLALGHVTVIEEPETVAQVAVGDDSVHVEFYDHKVLISPQQAGVNTDLIVFTTHHHLTYNLVTEADGSMADSMIVESFPPVPPPPPGPTPDEIQDQHDGLFGPLLLSSRQINTKKVHVRHGMQVHVESVSEDATNYYVRLSFSNIDGGHLYRLMTPKVERILPSFGIQDAYRWMNMQLPSSAQRKYRFFSTQQMMVHGSTLTRNDVQPGGTIEWVMALKKPQQPSPSVYKFTFGDDDGIPVTAIAVF